MAVEETTVLYGFILQAGGANKLDLDGDGEISKAELTAAFGTRPSYEKKIVFNCPYII